MKTKQRVIVLLLSICIMLVVGVLVMVRFYQDMQENGQDETIFVNEEQNTHQNIIDQMGKEQLKNIEYNSISDNRISETVMWDETDTESLAAELDTKVQESVQAMSTEEKAAQLFFVTPEALTGYQLVTAAGNTTRAALQEYPVGGIVYFARNLTDPQQTAQMLTDTQEYAMQVRGIPAFLGVDEEGGRVLRIGNNDSFSVERVEAMGKLVKGQDAKEAVYFAGNTIGEYLSELGFNVDFAPDADVLVNADNAVIGDRSFGEEPQFVADMAWAFAQGLHDNRVLACYKHFPGHGGTSEDSHTGAAYLTRTKEQLEQTELVPFVDGSSRGIDFIMVSHISDKTVTGSDEPASLSKVFVTDILREELGYEGIIITDSLSMGAITEHYNSGDAAVMALQAGCDMILMPQDFRVAYRSVLDAIDDGTISEERLDESVKRIVRAKINWLSDD